MHLSGTSAVIYCASGSFYLSTYRGSFGDIVFFPDERLRGRILGSNGNWGVNSDTPDAKLSINGGIHVGGDSDPGDNNLLVDGTAEITGAFGCNTKTPQTAYASGGALAAYATGGFGLDSDAHMQALFDLVVAMRAALVANGIMS
jgi:hypothetical protein